MRHTQRPGVEVEAAAQFLAAFAAVEVEGSSFAEELSMQAEQRRSEFEMALVDDDVNGDLLAQFELEATGLVRSEEGSA